MKGWAQKSQVGRGPSPAVPSAPALPSLCTLRLLQEAFRAFQFLERTHIFKSLWCKLGSALVVWGPERAWRDGAPRVSQSSGLWGQPVTPSHQCQGLLQPSLPAKCPWGDRVNYPAHVPPGTAFYQ